MGFRSRSGSNTSSASFGRRSGHLEFGDIGGVRSNRSMLFENRAMRYRSESVASIEEQLDHILDKLCLSDEDLLNVVDLVTNDVKDQMEKESSDRMRMLSTGILNLPDGNEYGDCVVLDFGGKFFRIAFVSIKEGERIIDSKIEKRKRTRRDTLIGPEHSKFADSVSEAGERAERVFIESAVFPMNKKILESPSDQLFGHISKLCVNFIKRFKLEGVKLPVVLVNSFACRHQDIGTAHLIRWTKGLKSEGVEGNDIGEILQNSLDSVGLSDLKVKYIVNDSVACLFTGLADRPNTRIGLIIGNGFNISFLDKNEEKNTATVINTELGSIGEDGELDLYLTKYDTLLHASDLCHYGKRQTLEKMVTSRYVPELFRIICKDLTDQNLLFNGFGSASLEEPGKFPPDFFPQLLKAAEAGDLNQVQDVLFNADLSAMYADADAVVRIANSLMLRSAGLVSAALAGVINANKSSFKKCVTVAADGTTWKFYPRLAEYIEQMTQDLVGHELEILFRTSFDGSAKGAAFIAAKHN